MHDRGIGTEILSYLTMLAKRQGLLGFTAEVLVENSPMMHLFEQGGFDVEKHRDVGVYELKLAFRETHLMDHITSLFNPYINRSDRRLTHSR